ncbi:MAG: alpha-E domain-containing protein [Proteobacteria bacterium]|nr:alpha-E domain-containing protein [Pseudomonadota bacterium]
MLSRTAEHLFWMARYMERAENLARLLDTTWQMSLVRQSRAHPVADWAGVIALHSLEGPFGARHADTGAERVLHFMTCDDTNPASIHGCLRQCRENAHAVRGTITTEMWETINTTWLTARRTSFEQIMQMGYVAYFEWVKERSSLSRGVTLGTLLQDECYHFIRLGTLLERADSTARILDARYHGSAAGNGDDASDDAHWAAALVRAVSAVEAYRRVWRDAVTSERALELMLLRRDMPRSLRYCLAGVVRNLEAVSNAHSADVLRTAGKLHAEVQFARVEDILAHGVHAWLEDKIDRLYALGQLIGDQVLNPMLADAAPRTP